MHLDLFFSCIENRDDDPRYINIHQIIFLVPTYINGEKCCEITTSNGEKFFPYSGMDEVIAVLNKFFENENEEEQAEKVKERKAAKEINEQLFDANDDFLKNISG